MTHPPLPSLLFPSLASYRSFSPVSSHSYNFAENVELTDPILQRFDVLCILQDTIDSLADERLANFVVKSHMYSHPDAQKMREQQAEEEERAAAEEDERAALAAQAAAANAEDGAEEGYDEEEDTQRQDGPQAVRAAQKATVAATGTDEGDGANGSRLEHEMLRKYIAYAKNFVKPVLADVDAEKVASLYAELREASQASGGVPIAIRHIESVLRMAEASARIHLRDHVREDDVDLAIKVMLDSFLAGQKVSVRRLLEKSFRKYINYGEENSELLMHQLSALHRDALLTDHLARGASEGLHQPQPSVRIYVTDLLRKAGDLGIYDLRGFFASSIFRSSGFRLDEANETIVFDLM